MSQTVLALEAEVAIQIHFPHLGFSEDRNSSSSWGSQEVAVTRQYPLALTGGFPYSFSCLLHPGGAVVGRALCSGRVNRTLARTWVEIGELFHQSVLWHQLRPVRQVDE